MDLAELSAASSQTERRLRDLAQEIVRDIYEVPDILKRFGIDYEEYHALAETHGFRQMLAQAASEWDAASNTPERIKLKSALMVENVLPDMLTALADTKQPLTGRVELLKTMAKIGGLGNAPLPNASTGQTFRLEINLGDPAKNVVIEHQSGVTSESMPAISEFGGVEDEF